ncbi:hypothetical protein ACFL1G_02690 [Planctomycetota bacterium]
MICRFLTALCGAVIFGTVFFAGCGSEYLEDKAATELKVAAPNEIGVHIPAYAADAIAATGGRQLWTKTLKIELDCVVTFYRADGSFYLTRQQYEIEPFSNSISIFSKEPQGEYVYQLSAKGFSVLQTGGQIESKVKPLCGRSFAEAMLFMTTAAVRFLDESAMFTRMPSPVRKEGLWYHAYQRVYSVERGIGLVGEGVPILQKIVLFYQNRNTRRVDMLWFADMEEERYLGVHGYDYLPTENHEAGLFERPGVLIPGKIELFRTDRDGILQNRLLEVDVKAGYFTPF